MEGAGEMGALEEIGEALGRVAGAVGPAVVGIGDGWARGSGVVVADGKVLTNAHNLRGGEATVMFPDGRSATGSVEGVDADGDLAAVSVDTAGVTPVTWGEQSPAVGSPVFAVSNPGGRGTQVTVGFVSGVSRAFRGPRGRKIAGSVEHTAPLARGSSGSPIVDGEGRFVGLNTNRLGEGFYAAIPADASLRERVDALLRGESASRPRLGIGVAPGHVARHLRRAVGLPERDGLLVRAVEDGGPAGRAGIQAGDLVVEAGGRAVASVDDLWAAVDATKGSLEVRIVRGTEERTVSVAFSNGEAAPASATGEA